MRDTLSFVHIADTHVGMSFKKASFAGAFASKKRQAIIENIQRVVDYCNAESIDLLLIAGDFLEAEYVTTADLYDLKYIFAGCNAKIVITAGNHDPLGCSQLYKIDWPEIVYISRSEYDWVIYEDICVSIVMYNWKSKGSSNIDMDKLIHQERNCNYFNIAMIHGDVYNDSDYMYLDKQLLLELPVDYVALGHIHKQDVIENKIVYPGSLEPLDFSETGNHGLIHTVIKGNEVIIKSVDTSVYPFFIYELDISGMESLREIEEAIKGVLEQYPKYFMLRVMIHGERARHLDVVCNSSFRGLIEERLTKGQYLEVRDISKSAFDIDRIYEEHKGSIVGFYIEAMREENLMDRVNQEALELGIRMLLDAMRG